MPPVSTDPRLTAVVQPGGGYAVELDVGEVLTIRDVAGMQIGDMVLFARHDPTERFSQAATRLRNGTVLGDRVTSLYATTGRLLATVVADDVAANDMISPACHQERYAKDFRAPDHPSCKSSILVALEPYGIGADLFPDPFNVFMRTVVVDGWLPVIEESPSLAGSSFKLVAEVPLVFATSSCPQDYFAANGYEITELEIQVFVAEQHTSARPETA